MDSRLRHSESSARAWTSTPPTSTLDMDIHSPCSALKVQLAAGAKSSPDGSCGGVLRFWPARPGPGATEENIILKGLIVSSRPMREPHRTHKAGRGKLPPSTKPGLSRLQVLTAHVCSRPHPTLYHCTPHAPDVREPRMFRATYSTNTTCDIHPNPYNLIYSSDLLHLGVERAEGRVRALPQRATVTVS
jgi:hypothetical protein